MKKFFLLFALCSLLFAIAGCATVPKPEYVFPLPPDRPRLKYLYDLVNEKDLFPKKKIPFFTQVWRLLIGEEIPEFYLTQPIYVCADATRVYVTDVAKKYIIVFDSLTRRVYRWGTSGPGKLTVPAGVAVDSEQRVYVADQLPGVVKVYDRKGNFLYHIGRQGWGPGELGIPLGLAINKERGLLYVINRGKNVVTVFDLQGNFLYEFSGRDGGEGLTAMAQYITVDKEGKVYVTDSLIRRVHIFDKEGKFLKSFGEAGDAWGYFARPKGIAVDSDGNIYVVDAEFERIQIFDPEGKLNFLFRGVPPFPFSLPQGLYVDERDRLYVVDTGQRRIQVYQYLK